MKFEKELEVAKAAAHKAGEIIMASYNRISEHYVDEKGRNDFVTVVDLESQRVILDAIRKAFPRDHVVAEESLPPVSTTAPTRNGAGTSIPSTAPPTTFTPIRISRSRSRSKLPATCLWR